MLQFVQLKIQFGNTVLFDNFSWHIKPNSKIGLIGPNGAGKTTLFQIACGRITPDSGFVALTKGTSISLFQQIPNFNPNSDVVTTVLESHKLYLDYHKRFQSLQERLYSLSSSHPTYLKLLEEQSTLEDFALEHGIHDLEYKAQEVLSGLGFQKEDFSKKVGEFSPGYQHRIALACALLNPHNLLLLDEPTNHLDDSSKEWLSEYLQETKASFVLVTHDPEFLDSCVNIIAEISPRGVTEFRGTLGEYLEQKNEIHEKLVQQYEKEKEYIQKRMEWIDRFRAKATKARQAQSALKKLEKREKLEKPEESFWNKKPQYKFRYASGGKLSFRLENASFHYENSSRFIFDQIDLEVSSGEKIAIIGKNGAGKSTLFRCIMGIHPLSSGKFYLGPKTKLGYFSQTHKEELEEELQILELVQKKFPNVLPHEIRNILGFFSFSGDKVFQYIQNLSGGEQSRLRLAMLVLQETNCLLLDEPTNHLDMPTREALKQALIEYEGSVLIISHDPDFLKGLCHKTYKIENGKLKDLNCSFEDYLKYHSEEFTSETSTQTKSSNSAEEYAKRNSEKNRIRKLQKEIVFLEDEVAKLQQKLESLEKELSSPETYLNANYQTKLEEYNFTKQKIEEYTEQWMKLTEKLG